MKTKYILFVIGITGIVAAVYGYFQQKELTMTIMSFICGASLVYGAIEIGTKENGKTN